MAGGAHDLEVDRRAAERGEAHVPALARRVLELPGYHGWVQAVPAGPRADAHGAGELAASLTELNREKRVGSKNWEDSSVRSEDGNGDS